MRKSLGVLIVLLLLLAVGCEQMTAPEGELFYRGQIVSTEKPAWLLNENRLGRVNAAAVELTEELPEETVFGLEGGTEAYLAEGGEVLTEGTWVDNGQSASYTVDVLKKTLLIFEVEATVTITNAINTQYKAPNGAWQMVLGDCTVQALEIRTGTSGSCTITSNIRYSIGEDGGDWG